MITTNHRRIAQTLVRDMWTVDWFQNVYTHGCYTEPDFLDDLLNTCGEADVIELRDAANRGLDAEWYYDVFCARF